MIKVECVSCKSPYDVDERRIPDKGMKMRCPKCNTSFMVSRDAVTSAIAAPGAVAAKNVPLAPPPPAADPRAAPQTPLPEISPPSAVRAIAPPLAAESAAAAKPGGGLKRTLLGPGAVAAPIPVAPAPVAKLAPGVQPGFTHRSSDESATDLPALKPPQKPAVPWGSLAPPSPDAKPPAPRPTPSMPPKGALGAQAAPPPAAVVKSSSAGSAFGSAPKHTMLGHAPGKAPELAFAEAAARLDQSGGRALDLIDLPAPKSANKAPVELPLVDLPAAKGMPPRAAGMPLHARIAPANNVAEPALVDLPAAKGAKPAAPSVQLQDLPAPKLANKPAPIAPALPQVAKSPPKPAEPALVDLPARKLPPPAFAAKPITPVALAPDVPLVDLPAPKKIEPVAAKPTMMGGFVDLPAPKGDLDRGRSRGITGPLLGDVDLPALKGAVDLPAPKGITDLPAPKGIVDLPAPVGIADLPTPVSIVDLPTPLGIADLPTRKGEQGFGELDLPVPKLGGGFRDEASFGDIELPELPVRAGFGDIELPVPRPGGDVAAPRTARVQSKGLSAKRDSDFGDLDLGVGAANRNDEIRFDDIRPDDLVALQSDASMLGSSDLSLDSEAPSARGMPNADYGEAGLLGDDDAEDMEFGIAAGEAEDGFALPPEILRRQRGEAAQAADVARGKRALHALIGVAVAVVALGGAGAALGLTDYGFFGTYFLERYLPEAGDPRVTRDGIARAEKTAVNDTYRDARRSLALLGEMRHKTGINRELLTRSLLHESLFMVRFGADSNSSAHVAAILARLEERHGLAPGMNLARAADAARRSAYADAENFLSSARAEAPQDAYVGLLAGEVAMRQAKLAEAEKAFSEALKHGGGARAQWGLARVALARTDDAARRTAVEETLKLSPLHVEARLADARILWGQGREERALHDIRQALGQEPVDDQYLWTSKPARAEAFSLLGYAHESRGRLHPARTAYEDALSADPYLVEALLGAGRVLLRERRFSDALARFESGLSLAQKSAATIVLSGRRADVEARLGQGRAQLALNRAPDAKASLAPLLLDNPNDAEIVLAMGQVEDVLGNKVVGEELLKKAVELAPTTFASYLALSQHYFKLSQPDKASETLNEAASKVEENVEMRRMLGQSELARNRFDSAVHEFKRAVELDPTDLESKFGLGVAYRKTPDLEKARVLFEEIAERDPQYAGLTLERGQLLEAQGDFAKAVEAYRAARDKDPSDTSLTLRLGAAQVEAGLLDDADQTLQTVIRETPNSAEAEYFTGRLALARGRGPDALTHFDRALSLDGAQAIYHLYAARAALEMANLGRTLEEADAALTRDAALGDAYWIRGIVRVRSGAVKDALKDAKRALELSPGRYDAHALMAECYDELRQLPEAVAAYNTALAKDPKRSEWWYKLGRLYLDMGERAPSNEALSKAMALGDKQEPMPYWLPDAYRLSGDVARANGNRKQAVAHYKHYLAIAPDGALDRSDVRKLLKSWDIDLSDD